MSGPADDEHGRWRGYVEIGSTDGGYEPVPITEAPFFFADIDGEMRVARRTAHINLNRKDHMTDMTAAEVDSILTQLEAAGVIKRGKTSIRLTTYGRELVKRSGKGNQ